MSTTYGILYKNGINYSHDTAESISYDNTTSGLTSTDMQAVITEANSRLVPTGGTTAKYLRGDGTWQTSAAFNTTYPVMSSGTSGRVPTGGTTNTYLRGDGTWNTPDNTTYPVGNGGLVKKLTGATDRYFRGDANWIVPGNSTYPAMSVGTTGRVPTGGTIAHILRGDGWQTSAAWNTTYAIGAGGIATKLNSSTASYLRGDGKWATPTDVDQNISQYFVAGYGYGNGELRVLYSNSANDTTEIAQARKGRFLYAPNGVIYLDNNNSNGNLRYAMIQPKLLRINLKAWIYHNATQNTTIQSNTDGADTTNYGINVGVADSAWSFHPQHNGNLPCGNPNYRWKAIYANNGTINTSDRNVKDNITELEDSWAEQFIMDLKPVSYKFKNINEQDSHDRTHYGLIAQDVEETMNKMGMTALDFAGFCKDPKLEEYLLDPVKNEETGEYELNPDGTIKREKAQRVIEGEYLYSLRYEEFISPIMKTIQARQRKLDEQEAMIQLLESRISQLENSVAS